MLTLKAAVLAAAVLALARAKQYNCDDGCDTKWKPVCGEDENTYANECIAACQDIAVRRSGDCLAGLVSAESGVKPAHIRDDGKVTKKVLNMFADEGFTFTSLQSFVQPPAEEPRPTAQPAAPSAGAVKRGVKAYRITSMGYAYTSSSKRGAVAIPTAAAMSVEGREGMLRRGGLRSLLGSGEDDSNQVLEDGSDAPAGGRSERDLVVFGVDDRQQVTTPSATYPQRVMGQIIMTKGTSAWTCSGSIVGNNAVLTAGHCVHSGAGGGWYETIKFAPARSGSSNPYGIWSWSTATTFSGWSSSSDFNWDMAVINFKPKNNLLPGQQLGWMGMGYTCTLPGLMVSGYPGDKPSGTQWYSGTSCTKYTLPCNGYIMQNNCDIMGGNSGGAVWNTGEARVYGVVSFEIRGPGGTTALPDTSYGTQYYNGHNMLNSAKWSSIVAWASK